MPLPRFQIHAREILKRESVTVGYKSYAPQPGEGGGKERGRAAGAARPQGALRTAAGNAPQWCGNWG